MGFVDGALGDPAFEELFLGGGKRLVRFLVRHHVIFVLGKETFDDFAFVRFARDDGDGSALAGLEGEFSNI